MKTSIRAFSIVVCSMLVLSAGASPALAARKHPRPTPTPTPTTSPTAITTPSPTPTTSPTASPSPSPTSSAAPGGYDISFPQCGGAYPASPTFGIVGVTGGKPYSTNPCLAPEFAWAPASAYSGFYMNTADPGSQSTHWNQGGPRACSGASDDLGCAYDYGWNAASSALAYAQAQTSAATTRTWWLDVESANTWSTNQQANASDIQGSIDYLQSQGIASVGIYSTRLQWDQIDGGYSVVAPGTPQPPAWLATGATASQAPTYCNASNSFTGGAMRIVQYPSGGYDGDYGCPI